MAKAKLYYIHDPMCSWCWGFAPVWQRVHKHLSDHLSDSVTIQYLLGGLAPDTDEFMSTSMQASIKENWYRIKEEIPGTRFNFEFWQKCKPRRSTYPACRAVIAAGMQRPSLSRNMINAIQQAYYVEAKNPSDIDVLIELAENVGLKRETFISDIKSEACQRQLSDEIRSSRKLGINSFPSLVLRQHDVLTRIPVDYTDSDQLLRTIMSSLK